MTARRLADVNDSFSNVFIGRLRLLACCYGLAVVAGCADRYQQGYQEGYASGYAAAEEIAKRRLEEEQQRARQAAAWTQPTRAAYSTEVCGGSGVNVNGRHVAGGKTACVRVFSDGTFHRY